MHKMELSLKYLGMILYHAGQRSSAIYCAEHFGRISVVVRLSQSQLLFGGFWLTKVSPASSLPHPGGWTLLAVDCEPSAAQPKLDCCSSITCRIYRVPFTTDELDTCDLYVVNMP